MDILHGLVNEPLFSSFAFFAVKIFKILEGTQVQGGLLIENLTFSDVIDLNLSSWHKQASLSVQPLKF